MGRHYGLIKVAIEGELLHIDVGTHFDKGLTGRIGAVKHALEQVKYQVSGTVLLISTLDVDLEILFRRNPLSGLGKFHDGFSAHAGRLRRKVDAFTRGLGHRTSSITH